MNTLGERIKLLRGRRSQKEFAKELGIPPTTLGNYENNKSELNFAMIDQFVTIFKVNIEWLLFGRGPMYGEPSHSQKTVEESIDTGRLTEAIKVVEQGLGETQRTMLADKKAELIAAIYDFLLDEKEINTKKVINIIKAVS